MKVVAIVLAAGEGRRMGVPKALVPMTGGTFLGHACRLLHRPGVESVVAVIGAAAERVRAEAPVSDSVQVVVNEAWRSGMLSSVQRGLEAALDLGADAALLHPVDHPLVAPETVDRVVDALLDGAFAAVPTHEGRRGHPGGFGAEALPLLQSAPPDRGARAVLADHPDRVVHVEGDPGCRINIDTRSLYRLHLGD